MNRVSTSQPWVGPVKPDFGTLQLLLCTECDKQHPLVIAENGDDTKERDCVVDWLTGQQLSADDACCFCFETDPFPTEDFPNKLPSERRYFHYVHIARLLGVKGQKNRAKLPKCVTDRIASMYPDLEGAATKVGFREA